jgi:hypothetical protein
MHKMSGDGSLLAPLVPAARILSNAASQCPLGTTSPLRQVGRTATCGASDGGAG